MIALAARNLTHRYAHRAVLTDVSLDIAAGDVFAIYGPNGAGKSTLLRLLALLERPTEGRVLLNGAAPARENLLALRREIVLVFQQPRLFRTSVLGNVTAALLWRGAGRAEAAERAAWALARVGLAGFERRSAMALSGGEAQLVSLARALAVRPRVLCLDEPTSDLDPRRSNQLEDIIHAVNQEFETTIVLVTHNLAQGRRLATTGALLVEGRIARTGPSAEVFEESLAEFGISE